MKKIISYIILITLVVLLSGCKNNNHKKIGILIYDKEDTFMKEYLTSVINTIEEEYYYEVGFADRNQLKQTSQFINFIDRKFDLIIVNAVDRLQSGSFIEKAEQNNIPLIFINREPQSLLNDSKNSYYVGSDSKNTGLLQANIVKEMVFDNKIKDKNNDGIIQTVILKGEQSHQDSESRTIEFIDSLGKLDISYELLAISVANWDRKQAFDKMKELDQMLDNIELVVSNNDDMALGTVDYLKEKYGEINLKIIGVDGTNSGLNAIDNNEIYATVTNDIITQTRAVKKITDYLLKGIVDSDFDYEERFQLIKGKIVKK